MSDYENYAIAREGLADTHQAIAEQATSKPRPVPILLDGCTCGGIGDTGSHRPPCPWAAR